MLNDKDAALLQEEHLDMMIRLAFELEEAEEISDYLDSPDPALTLENEDLADQALLAAYARTDAQNRTNRRMQRLHRAGTIIPKLVNIAACIILLLAAATPVALANSATFRSKVLELLVEFDHEKGEAYFSLVPNETEAFNVPEGWHGSYFPSYIPDGFDIYDFDPEFPTPIIEYRNAASNQLYFCEHSSASTMVTGTENAEATTITINGTTAYLLDGIASDGKTHTVYVIWQNDTNWFDVTGFGISTEEAIAVARSVRRVVK